MLVEQIWTGNIFRNYNYLIACPESGEALAIDPLDHKKCLGTARKRGWEITQVLNTHEHIDHTGGNRKMIAATGARLLAHSNAGAKIKGIDRGLGAGDSIKIGRHVELQCLDTPGHTMAHICLLSQTEQPSLFSGDTLFNAGAGNCRSGGHPETLYDTFSEQLQQLDGATRLYPGHDYLWNNLQFSLSVEPDNQAAQAMLEAMHGVNQAPDFVSDLNTERAINSFFRLESPSLINALQQRCDDLGAAPSPRAVFVKLRELRNSWSVPWSQRLKNMLKP